MSVPRKLRLDRRRRPQPTIAVAATRVWPLRTFTSTLLSYHSCTMLDVSSGPRTTYITCPKCGAKGVELRLYVSHTPMGERARVLQYRCSNRCLPGDGALIRRAGYWQHE